MNYLEPIREAVKNMSGNRLPRPKGSLSGHAAGLPFEGSVHDLLVEDSGLKAFRHFEFLNWRLGSSDTKDAEQRINSLGPKSIQILLSRSKSRMKNWSKDSPFEEKQNDTAETVVLESDSYRPGQNLGLVDVKTHNVSQKGQPPNIISAEKLAKSLDASLQEGKVLFDLVYVGVDWTLDGNWMKVDSVRTISLFKMDKLPYINWTAAQQIQFHVSNVDQEFQGTREEWAARFLGHTWRSLVESQQRKLEKLRSLQKYDS